MRQTTLVVCTVIHLVFGSPADLDSKGLSAHGEISKRMCKKYSEAIDTCYFDGVEGAKGNEASPKLYPHMAFVGYGNASSIKWLCGADLISENFVITAGHCTLGTPAGVPKWVKVGDYDLESDKDEELGLGKPAVYEVIEVIAHPEYKKGIFYNDVALLKLNASVEFNKFVRPICLHTEPELSSPFMIATGYGRKEFGGKRNTIMQQANTMVVPWEKCNDFYKSFNKQLANGINNASMLCAGETPSGKDICSMESGNPLQQILTEPKCMLSLVATASFSKRCGGEQPGVYSRVSYFVPWIESVVWG